MFSRGKWWRFYAHESLRRDFARVAAVNGNPVAGAARKPGERIGYGADGREKMLAVGAESKPKKVALPSFVAKARIRIKTDGIRGEIEQANALVILEFGPTKAAVENGEVVVVVTQGDRDRQAPNTGLGFARRGKK